MPSRIHSAVPYLVGVLNVLLFNILFQIERGTFFGGDSSEFLRIAEALRSGSALAHLGNEQPIGYPLVLALAASLPGSVVVNALIFNALLYLFTIYAMGGIARLLGVPPTVTRVAQIGFALVPNTAAWVNLVLSGTMAMAMFVGSLWAYLRIAMADPHVVRFPRLIVLGALVGMLGLTRTEDVLLLPLVGFLVCGQGVFRRSALRSVVRHVAVIGLSGLLVLMVPAAVLGRGPASFIPLKHPAFKGMWSGRYDLEFTQYRLYRFVKIAEAARGISESELPAVRSEIYALKYTDRHEAPIDDGLLAQAYADATRLRELSMTHHLSLPDAYRQLALTFLTQDPWGYASRALKRLFLYLTGADHDWPPSHPAHWVYTVLFRPLSSLTYIFLGVLLIVNRIYDRWTVFVVGLWAAFPMLVHTAFIFDQRYAFTAIPLQCVVWGQAIHALQEWWGRRVRSTMVNPLRC